MPLVHRRRSLFLAPLLAAIALATGFIGAAAAQAAPSTCYTDSIESTKGAGPLKHRLDMDVRWCTNRRNVVTTVQIRSCRVTPAPTWVVVSYQCRRGRPGEAKGFAKFRSARVCVGKVCTPSVTSELRVTATLGADGIARPVTGA